MLSTRKLNGIFEKNRFKRFQTEFWKNRIFAYFSFVIDSKMIVGIAVENTSSLHISTLFAFFLNLSRMFNFFDNYEKIFMIVE